MRDLSEKVCLVIPCYNESQRLDFDKFNSLGQGCYILFVNDGSKDNTLDMIKQNLKKNMYVLDLEKNLGKGEAVRRGFLYIKTLPIYTEINWVGFWDADLSTPLYELNNYISYSKMSYENVDAIWGSRISKLGSKIKRFSLRHYFGRLFATLVGIVFKIESYDSQCGAKIFKKELIGEYFKDPFISRWIFDVELLLRMKHLNIIEYPLKEWVDIPGGTIKIFPTLFNVLFDIIKIKIKYHKKRRAP